LIKILAAIPHAHGAVSFYRGLGPLLRLEKENPEFVSVSYCSPFQTLEWPDIMGYDVLFMIRPETLAQREMMRQCKQVGMKVWADWDDLLWDLPKDHVLYAKYADKKVRKMIAECMSMADTNSFSTSYLTDRAVDDFGIHNDRLVENGIDFVLQPMVSKCQDGDNILWRGTHTHQSDLYAFRQSISNAALVYNRCIDFHGYDPFFLTRELPNHRVFAFTTIPDSLENIRNPIYKYSVTPLVDNPFNRAKSNIAALESIAAGILPIVPEMTEWYGLGLSYKNGTDLMQRVVEIESGDAKEQDALLNSLQELVKKNYNLSHKNAIRKNILKNLML